MWAWVSVDGLLAQGAGKQPDFWLQILPFLPIVVLFFLLFVMPQRREQKKRDTMLNSLKKNDRVVTIGGIIGTIANVSGDGKEITLKVDDNTRIKFTRSSISHKIEEARDESVTKTSL